MEDVSKLHVTISEGNTKLGPKIPSVSLPPGLSCRPDAKCYASGKCYALKAWRQYPKVREVWTNNWKLALLDIKRYFDEIDEYLYRHMPSRFRWHVAGDIPTMEYLDYIHQLARIHPNTDFLCFTKRGDLLAWDILRQSQIKNLHLVYSAWPGMHVYNSVILSRFPVAWAEIPGDPDTEMPKGVPKCSGSCQTCGRCWLMKPGQNVRFPLH